MEFKIGDKVRVKADGEVGEILSINVSADGVRYTISSKEVDLQKKEVLEGVKHLMEDEVEAVDDIEEALKDAPVEEENVVQE